MTDPRSRRSLLSTAALLGATGLAGCGGRTQRADSESSPDTRTDSSTATAEGHSETSTGSDVRVESALERTSFLRGETITVSVTVENSAESERTRTLGLSIGGQETSSRTITLGPGETDEIELTTALTDTGTQTVQVAGRAVGTIVVKAKKPESVRDVGAHYYPWYGSPLHAWNAGEWSLESPSTPVLGNYNSTTPDVIEQHIDWCRQAGISWLNVSWWGPNSGEDSRLLHDILAHPRADELQWSILYETTGRLGSQPVKLDDERPLKVFTEDLSYLAETYFQRDAYKHIGGRPVLYIWVGQNLRGDVEAAYEAAVDEVGVRPYLVADVPTRAGLDAPPITDIADAVTTYSVYNPDQPTADAFVDAARSTYKTWYRAAEYLDVDVIPTAVPGFDDTEITHVRRDNEPVPSTPEIYEQTADAARRYADGPVLVTSFNEWYEDTQIEPSEEHGTAYLDITAETIASRSRAEPTFDGETFVLSFDSTVSESSMNPAIENGRQLTFMLYRLTIRDGDGNAVVDVDVGTDSADVDFLLGAYGPEQSDESTWRWLGGGTETVVNVPMLPSTGRIEFSGLGAAEMTVELETAGGSEDTTRVTTESGTYTLSLR